MVRSSISALTLAALLTTGCDLAVTDPQTLVRVGAGPSTTARATWLRVTVRNNEDEVVERSTRAIPAEVAFPVRPAITAEGGDAQRRFELVAEAFDTAVEPTDGDLPFNVLRVLGGFVAGVVVEMNVELTDACIGHIDCGDARTCWQGQCRGACFEQTLEGQQLFAPTCTECQSCARGLCADLAVGSPCGCPGDECQGPRCDVTPQVSETSGSPTHTCGLTGRRDLYCWGSNDQGQLGLGGGPSATTPQLVGSPYRRIAAGGRSADEAFACAITSSPSVTRCWGSNDDGQLGTGVTGGTNAPTDVDTGLIFDEVAAGASHVCAFEPAAGRLHCWGAGRTGRLGDGTTTDRDLPGPVSGSETWLEVCAGAQHSCGVDAEGRIFCWGHNQDFQVGTEGALERVLPVLVPQEPGPRWTKVACGSFSTCGLRDDGVVSCWGGNELGNLGRCSVDRSEGTGSPAAIESVLRFQGLDCGGSHCCAITRETNRLFCWGASELGQVGAGTTLDRVCVPQEIAPGVRFSVLGLGVRHSCATDEDGGLWCWGANDVGQLGLGHTDPQLTPARVCFP